MKKTLFGNLDAFKLGNYSLNGPGGKKSASGSLNVSGSGTFTYADGTGGIGMNAITVSVLNFIATKIIYICPVKGSVGVYNAEQPILSGYSLGKIAVSNTYNSTFIQNSYSATLRNFQLDGTGAYVNATGFKLPHPTSSGDLYYWWAFE